MVKGVGELGVAIPTPLVQLLDESVDHIGQVGAGQLEHPEEGVADLLQRVNREVPGQYTVERVRSVARRGVSIQTS